MENVTKEILQSVAKKAIGLIPVPAVAALIGVIEDFARSATEQSVRAQIDVLADELERVHDRLDARHAATADCSEQYKSMMVQAYRTHHRQKLVIAARLVVNVCLRENDPDRLSRAEREHFTQAVDRLSTAAIAALSAAYAYAGSPKSLDGYGTRVYVGDITARLRPLEPSLVMGLLGQLHALNLVHMWGSPSVRVDDYKNYGIELTPLGVRFVRSLMEGLHAEGESL